ncbi:hypothetical protein ACPA9J_35265 [Pseudomonas aeruginosa]
MTAAGRGRRVRVLDHANKAGKNPHVRRRALQFTNPVAPSQPTSSRNPHFYKSALARYT